MKGRFVHVLFSIFRNFEIPLPVLSRGNVGGSVPIRGMLAVSRPHHVQYERVHTVLYRTGGTVCIIQYAPRYNLRPRISYKLSIYAPKPNVDGK